MLRLRPVGVRRIFPTVLSPSFPKPLEIKCSSAPYSERLYKDPVCVRGEFQRKGGVPQSLSGEEGESNLAEPFRKNICKSLEINFLDPQIRKTSPSGAACPSPLPVLRVLLLEQLQIPMKIHCELQLTVYL